MTADNDIVERLPRWKTGPVLREHPGYFLVPVRDIDEAAAEIVRLRGEVGSCPSGDGSLRWPCKAHPTAAIAPAEAKGDALHPAQKALRKIRARANEPGTRASHGEQFANGLRCAANILEEALNKAPQPADGEAVAPFGWAIFDEAGRYMTTALTEKLRDSHLYDPTGSLPAWSAKALYTTPPAPVQAAPQEGEAVALARKFHDTYERLAPSFGYETRQETRQFDPETPNGRLMIAVCAELATHPPACELGAVRELVKAWREQGDIEWKDKRCELTNVRGKTRHNCADQLEAALQHRGDSQEVGRG